MAKTSEKKKNVRLRRRIRKTLGSACLITSLLVASIPVPEASAAEGDGPTKLTWEKEIGGNGNISNYSSKIPLVPSNCDTIYTTEDGMYQFAWVKSSENSTNYIAVILGFNAGTLSGGNLVIPDTVDAYTKFNPNDSSDSGYVAVSRSQKPLYYMSTVVYEKDVSGNDIIGQIDYKNSVYSLCDVDTRNQWMYVGEGTTRVKRPLADFYYLEDGEYKPTEDPNQQWIREITVAYIGNQYLEPNNAGPNENGIEQEWKIAAALGNSYNKIPENGIFANRGNITNLTVGPNLIGIGNYAFYNCSTLTTITLGNGIEEIGHDAFAHCYNMRSVGLEFNSNLNFISDYAFYDCRALTEFQLPAQVTRIFDHAFDGCKTLKKVDLNGKEGGKNVGLAELGYYVFNGCEALEDLELPASLKGSTVGSTTNAIHLNNFAGCSSLKRIRVLDSGLHPVVDEDGGSFTLANFKNSVDPTFYFEGTDSSNTHAFTKETAVAFKYEGQDRYEIIIMEYVSKEEAEKNPDTAETAKLTYQVNSRNELLYFDMEKPVEEVTIPSTIGPYGVSTISEGSFGGGAGSCFLRRVTIPATVTSIGNNAFKGCHNLQHVFFADASKITSIGTNAFATQLVEGSHQTGCTTAGTFLKEAPLLTFTGAVGDDILPFTYAMKASSNINRGEQPRTYITYYSGWPTNLVIRFVEDPNLENGGAATLIDYPTCTDLMSTSTKYTTKNYPYITKDYEDTAKGAYELYSSTPNKADLPDDVRQLVTGALNLSVPSGVKRIAPGLFSGKTLLKIQNADGTYKKNADGNYIYADTVTDVDGRTADKYIQSVTFADIDEFEPYSFTGCTSLTAINITGGKAVLDDYAFAWEYPSGDVSGGDGERSRESNLTSISMTGGGSTVGNYAFANNYNLTLARLSTTVSQLGLRPFKDCPNLEDVDFSGGPYFKTDTAIIYGLSNGSKNVLVECLESRGDPVGSTTVSATETSGITEIRPEAFMNCDGVGEVDLSDSKIETVAARAFTNTDNLYAVYLPNTCYSIDEQAFHNSSLQRIGIPRSVSYISLTAFNHKDNPRTEGTQQFRRIDFFTELDEPKCAAVIYADKYENINTTEAPDSRMVTVSFWYKDYSKEGTPLTLKEQREVPYGSSIEDRDLPDAPDFTEYGYRFVGWDGNLTQISRHIDVRADYERIDSSETKFIVRYWLNFEDEEPFFTVEVYPGGDAPDISAPAKTGYRFIGWSGKQGLTNITQNLDLLAKYEPITGDVSGGNGSVSGNGTGNGNGNGNGNGSGTSSQMYTLTVRNGSGSGSYVAGATVIIVANEPASTQEFDKWTQEGSTDLKLASTTIAATTLVMPAANATVTATYTTKSGSGGGSGTGGSGSGGGNGSGGSNSPTVSGNGGSTTVIIDKNGLSNTGVVSVVINGSSDNFVLKISENSSATEAAIRALIAEFGSLDNIKYFPMDISLYDSTGKTKITDTSGLSITITLPLPDSMITYAGNNRIAGVVNDKLDKLSPKFTTIDGVSCITFTAEHFSPYVIYVNTSNLESTGVTDSSPKTGDIHPKWFIAIGLAAMSVILFAKKDKYGRKVAVQA